MVQRIEGIISEPFSFANSICGFGVKSGKNGSYIHYTSKELWGNPNIIDSPFMKINIDKNKRVIDELKENEKIILEIIKDAIS